MRRPSRGMTERLQGFVALAGRARWSLARSRRDLLWQRLQGRRLAGAPQTASTRPILAFHSRRRWWRGFFFPALAMGTAALVLAGHFLLRDVRTENWRHQIALEAGSEEVLPSSGDLQGPGDLTFSDGTRLAVVSTSRVVINGVTPRGAKIRLVRGTVDAHVRPRPDNRWVFFAGPFHVDVKGTSFRLDWQPNGDRLSLTMWSGAVVVAGGHLGRPLTVKAGESIQVSAVDVTATVLPHAGTFAGASTGAGFAPAPGIAPGAGDGPRAVVTRRRRPAARGERHDARDVASPRDARDRAWPDLLAEGEFAEIVKQARHRGIETTLTRGNDVDLAALADAARYTRDNQLARRVLLTLRTRYPGSERAKSGAFFLGRLGEAHDGDVDTALTWYERYLRESPRGPYAEGAMAREMVLLRQRSRGRAKAVAGRYLHEYPEGTYRDLAIRLRGPEGQ